MLKNILKQQTHETVQPQTIEPTRKNPTLNIIAYSDSAARRSFSEDNGQFIQWRESLYDGQLENRIGDVLESKYGSKDDVPNEFPIVKLGTIDEEYYVWLGLNPDTSENRVKYVNQMSEADASRLMRKYGNDWQLGLYALPIHVLNTDDSIDAETSFRLSIAQISKLTSFFKKNFVNSEVYIPGCILSINNYQDVYEDMYAECINAICHNEPFDIEKFSRQPANDRPLKISRYYIPIVIGYRQPSAVIDTSDMFESGEKFTIDKHPEATIFASSEMTNEDEKAQWAKLSFERGHVQRIIASTFPKDMDVTVDPYLVVGDDVLTDAISFLQDYIFAQQGSF